MADEQNKTPETGEQGKTPETPKTPEEPKTPEVDVKALNEQLQEALTEIARLKRDKDKASTEAAEFKKKYKASLDETEKASMEKAEKEAEREEQFKQLMRENTMNKIEKQYLAMGWTAEEATKMATAEVDGDFDAKVKIMGEVDARKKKDFEKEFLASRPDINFGTGNGQTYTKEQFDAMNPTERTKLFRENKVEYDRLMAL